MRAEQVQVAAVGLDPLWVQFSVAGAAPRNVYYMARPGEMVGIGVEPPQSVTVNCWDYAGTSGAPVTVGSVITSVAGSNTSWLVEGDKGLLYDNGTVQYAATAVSVGLDRTDVGLFTLVAFFMAWCLVEGMKHGKHF